jgi:subtilase family serine protease
MPGFHTDSKRRSQIPLSLLLQCSAWITLGVYAFSACGQSPNRISQTIDLTHTAPLRGSVPPVARPENDIGRISPEARLSGITVYFKLTAQQQADLDALVQAQQIPGSTLYHKWLAPAEYASRFGLSDSDLEKVRTWLELQGFTIDRISDSHTSISFSGTVRQVELAFQTEIHRYKVDDETHFANATQLAIPAALAEVIQSVRNLNDFRPKPQVRFRNATPAFTSSQSGNHYLTPKDVATIYDVNAAYSSGYNGTGQSIAIVGQSQINVSDIEHFQSAAGLTVKDPTLVLVPGSGTAQNSSGDEAESDLDLEYSGGMGTGATIYFVYVGNNQNYSVFDSVQYAVDTRIAPIVSISYGACETGLSTSDFSTLESIMEQGASQGQSIISASGDDGSTSCYGDKSLTNAQQEALVVSYPASSAFVTGLGGTEFPASDVSSSNTTYWQSASGSDVVGSAKSYIPEQTWNDDSSQYGLGATGGGISVLTARPSWQKGVAGIPSGSYRLVPDISFSSSPSNAGYLYCTSDTSAWSQGQQGSCTSGFRDSSTNDLTVAGGTSFAAPIFAGMLTIINQKENSTGQGLINSTLYTLASSSSTYASAFHDITSGGNQCTAGSQYCSSAGQSEYPATTGYDMATGLGSIDLYNLLSAWPAGSSLQPTTTSLAAATNSPASGANDTITIKVAAESTSVTTVPTGTLNVIVDGTTVTSSLALSNGSASYTFSSTASGGHVIEATYSGDATFAQSTGSVTVNVGGSGGGSSGSGGSASATVTVAPAGGYTGTVQFSVSTSSTYISTYGCYTIADATVSGSSPVNTPPANTTLTVYIGAALCSGASMQRGKVHPFAIGAIAKSSSHSTGPSPDIAGTGPALMLLSGLLCWSFRRKRALLCTLVFLGLSALIAGCGGSSPTSKSFSLSVSPSTVTIPAGSSGVPTGNYPLTITGTDTSNKNLNASTTLTLTLD